MGPDWQERARHVNRRDLPTLLADLDDLALRCKDAGVAPIVLSCLGRARDCLWLESQTPERDSVPPVLDANRATRALADSHFQAARKILKGIG